MLLVFIIETVGSVVFLERQLVFIYTANLACLLMSTLRAIRGYK